MELPISSRLWCCSLRLVCLVSALSLLPAAFAGPVYLYPSSSEPPTYDYREFPAGSSLTLRLTSPDLPGGTPQWLHDEQPITGANGSSLVLPSLSPGDAGNYRVRFGDLSSTTYSETFTVNVLPATVRVVDTTFSSQLPADYWVSSITAFADDGSSIVQNVSANPAPPVRLASDGSLVSSFHFPSAAGDVLAGFPDGRLITSKAPYLLTRDGASLPFILPPAFDATKPLSGAAVTTDGKFYLSQGTTIVRCLADGTVDPTFTFATTIDTISTVYTVDAQNRLYVAGHRVDPNPYNFPSAWDVIYRLRLDGTFDVAFDEPSALYHYGSARTKLVPLADGRIFHWSAYHGYYTWRMLDDHGAPIAGWSGGLYTDYAPVVDPVRALVYLPVSSGLLKRFEISATGLVEDTTFFPGVTASWDFPPIMPVAPDGKLLLLTDRSTWEGHATQAIARIRTDIPRPVLPPSVGAYSDPNVPPRGSVVTLTSQVSGDGPYTYQWYALDGQPLPASTTGPKLVIPNFSATNFGRYQLRVVGAFGSVLSNVVPLALSSSDLPYLANLSGRAVPGAGEDATIAGVTTRVYAGAVGVPLLIRGAGPSLKSFGVAAYLPNPALNLLDRAGQLVGDNDNWGDSADHAAIATDATMTGAFSLHDLDAAMLLSSRNQQYTVQLFDQGGAKGSGLLEIYRVPDDVAVGELTNLSLRAHTGPGDDMAIAGFVIVDPQNFDRPARVLLRVVGPTLQQYGIAHPVADPVLTLFNAKGEIVRRIDNWGDDSDPAALAATMKQVGAFDLPSGSKDAAVVLDLPAGAYTLHAGGGEGIVLMEIYLVR